MNLWARILGQLAILAVALFFFSCEDETSILGFRNPNKQFKVNYVDIPLQSDVFLMDSLRTSNNLETQDETRRLLTGRYTDPQFGQVTATAYTQFFTTQTAKTLLKETATLDSVSLQLRFDFYTYGSTSVTPQTISIHELEKELQYDSINYLFNKAATPYNPTPLGSKTFSYSPENFKKYTKDRLDTTITVRMPLDLAFGQRIFNSARQFRDGTTAADSAFVRAREFVKQFKGIAIVTQDADKIFGFSQTATASRITLHYHDSENDSLQLHLAFSGMTSYNGIKADRSGTPLEVLPGYAQPVTPDNDLRYVQSGTGVLTRLDFSNLYNFIDADTNTALIINEAELFLGAPEGTSVFDPVDALSLRAISDQGYLRRLADRKTNPAQYYADSLSLGAYGGQLTITGGMFTPVSGQGIFTISKSGDNAYFNGFLTLFAQQLSVDNENLERFRYFAIFPESPQIGKSVNRLIFQQQNIKLRVYYTRPTQPQL